MQLAGLNPMTIGFVAIIIGVVLMVLGFILEALKWFRGGKVKAGGAVLIGPFPVIFGDRELLKYSLILLVIMVVLTLVLILIPGVLR